MQKYEVSEEQIREDKFNDPSFQAALRAAADVPKSLVAAMRTNPIHAEADTAIRDLYQSALRLQEFQHHETRTVGFVGDSGAGKHIARGMAYRARGIPC